MYGEGLTLPVESRFPLQPPALALVLVLTLDLALARMRCLFVWSWNGDGEGTTVDRYSRSEGRREGRSS